MVRLPRLRGAQGFTLIELMIVAAILTILVSVATTSYRHFMDKAKAVEGEIVVHEVERLQHLYHAAHQSYTDSLAELGFAMSGKYYFPEVRMGSESTGVSFQVRALPVAPDRTQAWLLTWYKDGRAQIDQGSLDALAMFASVRFSGNGAPLSSSEATALYVDGNLSGIQEPEWSGTGRALRCQECGRVVVHQKK